MLKKTMSLDEELAAVSQALDELTPLLYGRKDNGYWYEEYERLSNLEKTILEQIRKKQEKTRTSDDIIP